MLELKSTPSQRREAQMCVPVDDTAAVTLAAGQFLNIATNGELVVGSLFAFATEDRSEWLSVGNTRILLGTLRPCPGERLFSNRRRALFVWVEESGRGHDLLLPPYPQPTAITHSHLPARARLEDAFLRIGGDRAHMPDPINFFLDTRIDTDGRIKIRPSNGRPGGHVVLRATTALDCLILVWSTAERQPGADEALVLAITNHWPSPRLAAGS